MKTRPVLWSLALATAVVLAGCNKHDNANDTMQPGANTAPAATTAMPAGAPATPPGSGMPATTSTAPASSSSAMMPPPTMPATTSSSGH